MFSSTTTVPQTLPLVQAAQILIRPYVGEGSVVIDATAGNGKDTRFLASRAGHQGYIYACDLQAEALRTTAQHLADFPANRLRLLNINHAELLSHIAVSHIGQVDAAMFNLGYLPGGSKAITTRTETTLPALEAACSTLSSRSILSILTYPGHTAGQEEFSCILQWLKQQSARWDLHHLHPPPNCKSAPQLFIVTCDSSLLQPGLQEIRHWPAAQKY